jgi:transposase
MTKTLDSKISAKVDPRDELILGLRGKIKELQEEILKLQLQLKQDSKNSHRPPSSDGFNKRNPGKKTKKHKGKQGGQLGHSGKSLERSLNPDEVISLKLNRCPGCETCLEEHPTVGMVCRQEWEIPPIELKILEWQADQKWCSGCDKVVTAPFPEQVKAPVQYGPHLRAFGLYLHCGQFLPLRRVGEVFEELFGVGLSSATLLNQAKTLDPTLHFHEEWIRMKLLEGSHLHSDETGLRLQGTLHWLHVNCNDAYTLYTPHSKRGKEGVLASEVMAYYSGTHVHDHWPSYYCFGSKHSFCGAHLLRELEGVMEEEGALWARDLKGFLLELKTEVDQAKRWGETNLSSAFLNFYWLEYQNILSQAQTFYAIKDPPPSGKRGRKAQHKGKNLLDRFIQNQKAMILWAFDFDIPFTNNQAERDLRMMKLRQKISGSFQAEHSLVRFARIRSILASLKKQKIRMLPAIQLLFQQREPALLPCFQ